MQNPHEEPRDDTMKYQGDEDVGGYQEEGTEEENQENDLYGADDDENDFLDEIDDEELSEDELIEKYWNSGKIANQALDQYLPIQQLNQIEDQILSLLDTGAEIFSQLSETHPSGDGASGEDGGGGGQDRRLQLQESLVEGYVRTVRTMKEQLGNSIRRVARLPKANYKAKAYTEIMQCQIDQEKENLLQELGLLEGSQPSSQQMDLHNERNNESGDTTR